MSERIICVTGSSRSGTSLVMRMLHEGGIPVVADEWTSYEDDRANWLPERHEWLAECAGKAVKILEPLKWINNFPHCYAFDFLLMTRNPLEQAKSQLKFLRHGMQLRFVDTGPASVRAMSEGLIRDTPRMLNVLQGYPNSRVMCLTFERLLAQPALVAQELQAWLNRPWCAQKAAQCVRQRAPECYPGFLENVLTYREKPVSN